MTGLSVCCLTGGDAPQRLIAILELLRPVADEIVVGVDAACDEAARMVTVVADRVATFPYADPSDRPIAWLFGLCCGRWIFNVDDDEVPGEKLLEELPQLVARDDVTHGWIARRWLYGDAESYLDEPPWSNEFQLRLVLNDARFLQFSDEFHRPVIAHGAARFVAAPLWHLDTLVNNRDKRRRKALGYERMRRGMRIGGMSHNSAFYLPELRPRVRVAPVPAPDARLVARVLGERQRPPVQRATVERATRKDVDRSWPGEPHAESLYRARLELVGVDWMTADVQQTVDVRVTNDSDDTWRWGNDAAPAIRLSYRWDGGPRDGLRTPLPCDVRPGETATVPVHVVPPARTGTHVLEIDLVHEFVRWFGCAVTAPVEVRPRRRVAVAGSGAALEELLDALLELPDVEPLILEPDEAMPERRFGHARAPGLRSYLFGGNAHVGAGLVARTAGLIAAAVRGRPATHVPDAFVRDLKDCDLLVVLGADWPADAPQTRELWRLAATAGAARALGVPVLVMGGSLPAPEGPVDRGLLAVLARLGPRCGDDVAAAVRARL